MLTIQVIFKDAIFISMAETKDILQMEVADRSIFVSQDTGYAIKEKKFQQKLVSQLIFGNSSKSLMATSESIEQGMQGVALGNLAVNVLLSGSLMHLWGMINSLQIIFHLPGNNLALPGNA